EVQDKIGDAGVVLVNGWNFRAPEFVKRHAQKIRAYFRSLAEVECASKNAVERLRQKADIVVGVHIRRGDYSNWRGGRCFFEVAQYAKWMHAFAEQFPGLKASFLICSDEPRNESEFPGLNVGFGA